MEGFYMNTEKYNPDAIRSAFKFLIDEFGYTISHDEERLHSGRAYAFIIEYTGNERRIHLTHDYKENFFYFTIIRGNVPYPNDIDRENIHPFWKIFHLFNPKLDIKNLQPFNQTCAEAALINAQLLKKYASDILRGDKWI